MAKQLEMMYEGKAKQVFATDDPTLAVIHYKDDATAFNGLKKGTISGKGAINNRITNIIMKYLEQNGIETHLIEELNERDTLVKRVQIVPLEVIMRNVAAGSMSKRVGVEEGTQLARPILEFSYKNDELGDPFINDDYAIALSLCTEEELETIRTMARRIDELLTQFFASVGLRLIDFKIEFGRTADGKIILADEISQDTCRLWDSKTNEKLDKDRFRRDLGGVEEAYEEALRRITTETKNV